MIRSFKIPLNRRQYFTVFGGPYRECPDTTVGVKMAAEIDRPCAVDIPTQDYQTPDRLLLYRGLEEAVAMVLAGRPLYVGCAGGIGRTGLFLAVLAKCFGVKKPVKYVRANYYAHAVETKEQMAFVKAFMPAPRARTQIKRFRRWAWLKFWKTNLTRMPEPPAPPKAVCKFGHVKLTPGCAACGVSPSGEIAGPPIV